MTKNELREAVLRALATVQDQSGRQVTAPLTDETNPFHDLPDFDSHNALEATVLLETVVGRELNENVFVDDSNRPLRVCQVVQRLSAILEEQH